MTHGCRDAKVCALLGSYQPLSLSLFLFLPKVAPVPPISQLSLLGMFSAILRHPLISVDESRNDRRRKETAEESRKRTRSSEIVSRS